jgi:hypothetical protein
MTAKELVDYVLKHSYALHPTYTKDEHKTWALGFIASIASEKNHMDNVIWARVKQRIEVLYDSNSI